MVYSRNFQVLASVSFLTDTAMTRIYCKQCELAVIVIDGEIIKACHCDAAIIAELKADIEAGARLDT